MMINLLPIVHFSSLNRKDKSKSKPRFKCTCCTGRTTKNQAIGSKGICIYCRAPLRAFSKFNLLNT